MTVQTEAEVLPQTIDETKALLHKAKVAALYSNISFNSAVTRLNYDEIQLAKRELHVAEDTVKKLVTHLVTLLDNQ